MLFFFFELEKGFLAFYKGFGATLLGLSHVALQFPLYEYMKEKFEESKVLPSPVDIICASAVSKVFFPIIILSSYIRILISLIKNFFDSSFLSSISKALMQECGDCFFHMTIQIVASTITYPHEVVRARLQNQRGLEAQYQGIISVVTDAIKKEGPQALFKGVGLNLLRVTPACVLTFTTYELFMQFTEPSSKP